MDTTLLTKRILIRSTAMAIVAGGLLALPVTSWPEASAKPITPDAEAIPVSGVDQRALPKTPEPEQHTADIVKPLEPAVVTDKIETEVEFGLVGVTFDKTPPAGSEVQVRVKEDSGWTGWKELPVSEGHGPDMGDPDYESVKAATEPLMTGSADQVQVRVDTPAGKEPVGTQIKVIEAEEAPADSVATASGADGPALATANAAANQPRIISRAAWGANEKLRKGCPGLTDAAKVAFIHHTASTTNYSAAQAPGQMRAIYSYATSNGYCDFPYNFAVDRYGNIYEGRGGGVNLPVKSGATASFNNSSVSVTALGNFTTTPSNGFAAMNTGIAKLVAWKLALSNRAANTTERLTAEGFRGGAPKGEVRTFNRISGHRNAFPTACPGDALYPQLGAIRVAAARYQGAIAGSPTVAPPSGKVTSYITQWAKTKRKFKRKFYRSSAAVSPGADRLVKIKKKRYGKRWANGKKWKVVRKIETNDSGSVSFALRARKRPAAYRLVAKGTDAATKARNGAMWLTRKR